MEGQVIPKYAQVLAALSRFLALTSREKSRLYRLFTEPSSARCCDGLDSMQEDWSLITQRMEYDGL